MKKLNELFEVTYGNKFDFNKMLPLSIKDGGVNFVGRSSQNHGVSGTVAPIDGVTPYEAGLITVSLGGSKLLSSFVQDGPFYTAQNVAVLKPKQPMTFAEKLFVCLSIRHNRFRYSAFGREANRTLRYLPIPERSEYPDWVDEVDVGLLDKLHDPATAGSSSVTSNLLEEAEYRLVPLSEVFDVDYGHSLELNRLNKTVSGINFVSRTAKNNGISAKVEALPSTAAADAGVITVALGGSVLETFVQPEPFYTGFHISILKPKTEMTTAQKLFYCTCIRANQYRYSFGRQANRTLKGLMIPAPDKKFMEIVDSYMNSLPYSSQLPSNQITTGSTTS